LVASAFGSFDFFFLVVSLFASIELSFDLFVPVASLAGPVL